MKNIYRDHYSGLLRESDIGSKVLLSGFIENIRDHGGILFLDLRDEYGTLQLVTEDDTLFSGLTKESTIRVTGIVRKRKEEDYNDRIETGTIEVLVETLDVLSKATTLPFEIMTSHTIDESIRLKYRYLDLRNKKVHDSMLFRSKFISFLREEMTSLGHVEIQTPILTASSPEGARDFIVPSRKFKGKFYALPQAPQIFKQLLMCSGFDRYFQIAPCFRDEDARSDRCYGEFYQLDFERAFVEEEDILELGEKVFYDVFTKFSDKKIDKPFIRLSYKESMEKYGTDKPDLRVPFIIQDLTDIFIETTFKPFRSVKIKGIKVPGIGDKSNSWFNEIVDYATSIGMPGIGYITLLEDGTFKGPIDKFLSIEERDMLIERCDMKEGDVLFFIASRSKARELASLIRVKLGEKLGLIDKNEFKFCIIKDFPMYEYDEENEKYKFCHNPFSLPKDLSLDMEDIEAYQYDFVCNGIEMASGAVRNHSLEIMKEVFAKIDYTEDVIKDKFGSLYEAFKYGAPPHAGMAIGIDRMIMLLLETESIRDTICFPLASSGYDPLMGSPSELTEKQLREVHIKVRD